MPRHAFSFPPLVREAVRNYVRKAVLSVNPSRFRQEAPYCAALAAKLEGIAYDGPEGKVAFTPTAVSDRGYQGAAEGWSGADLAITAEISHGEIEVRKAILVQAKRNLNDLPAGEVDRLRVQIAKMQQITRSPKLMDIRHQAGFSDVGVYSAGLYALGATPERCELGDYFVRRVLTTLDGDTRPSFVAGVQESDLTGLKVVAATTRRGRDRAA